MPIEEAGVLADLEKGKLVVVIIVFRGVVLAELEAATEAFVVLFCPAVMIVVSALPPSMLVDTGPTTAAKEETQLAKS